MSTNERPGVAESRFLIVFVAVGVALLGIYLWDIDATVPAPLTDSNKQATNDADAVARGASDLEAELAKGAESEQLPSEESSSDFPEVDLPPDHSAEITVVPASQYENDPYAEEAKEGALSKYKVQRSLAMIATHNMYYAVGCGVVFPTAAAPFYFDEFAMLREVSFSGGLIDNHITDDLKMASRVGYKRAQKPSACDYWHQHPEAVQLVRQAAKNSTFNVP